MDSDLINWLIGENVIDASFIVRFLIVMFVLECVGTIVNSLMKGVR